MFFGLCGHHLLNIGNHFQRLLLCKHFLLNFTQNKCILRKISCRFCDKSITSVIKFIFAMIESIPNVVMLMLLCKQYFLLHSENYGAKMILQQVAVILSKQDLIFCQLIIFKLLKFINTHLQQTQTYQLKKPQMRRLMLDTQKWHNKTIFIFFLLLLVNQNLL